MRNITKGYEENVGEQSLSLRQLHRAINSLRRFCLLKTAVSARFFTKAIDQVNYAEARIRLSLSLSLSLWPILQGSGLPEDGRSVGRTG